MPLSFIFNINSFSMFSVAIVISGLFSVYLRALWYDAKGDWEKAHAIAQSVTGEDAAWVHGYLHRKEGDLSNSAYWYSRAGRNKSTLSLEAEWEEIVNTLLKK